MKLKIAATALALVSLTLPSVAVANSASPTGASNGAINGQGFENASQTGLENGQGVGISKAKGKPHKKKKKQLKKKKKQLKKKLKKLTK